MKPAAGKPFRLWVFGDAHVGTDLKQGRESLAEAIRQSEGGDPAAPAFEWDLALNVGDLSGNQGIPADDEGAEVVRQYAALSRHPREAVYDLCGNHDRNHLREPSGAWFQKWADPVGGHTAISGVHADRRPFPIKGTWERYAFRAGNVLFLVMSDINEPSQKLGRGDLGGNPGGCVSAETFAWWKAQVEANPGAVILTAHHYMLKDTTTASGAWEGMAKNPDGSWRSTYHGYKPQGTPDGASYLYWVGGAPDAMAFERFLAERPGSIDLWIGGHTHPLHPDDRAGNKGLIETRWGAHFINAAGLTRYHSNRDFQPAPSSRLLTFTEGLASVQVQTYLHTADFRPKGWYAPAERTLPLSKPFSR